MEEIDQVQMLPGRCVVCKHLGRRCNESCTLSQYFPSETTEDFQNVHRLFGIRNAMKIVDSVEENDKDKTVKSLITEARIRLENPVHGSLGVLRKLRAQIEEAKKELDLVNQQLRYFGGDGQEFAPPPNEAVDLF